MAVLLVDVGNTAWKYCVLESSSCMVSDVQYVDSGDIKALTAQLPFQLDWAAVSSVGDPESIEMLDQAVASRCSAPLRQAVVENDWQGFKLGYEDVSRLGVDRWLAMLAVREQLAEFDDGAEALIADCGTAVTVERMTKAEHKGGLIAPGLRLMAAALNRDTADLPAVDAANFGVGAWAHGTESSIALGCYSSVVGLIQRQRQQTGNVVLSVLSGGDSEIVKAELPDWQWQPELVLEGLRLWACRAG